MSEISVVTPTFRRPIEVEGLLDNLCRQTVLPAELILVDGAPAEETATERLVARIAPVLPFACRYIRHGGGTAIQRNVGIDAARGAFVALVDDDIRLEAGFLAHLLAAFADDTARKVGGILGYRTNQRVDARTHQRWRWYQRLKFFQTYEPGRYDRSSGYPININLQPPFTGVREVDFITSGCAMWRREAFDEGLRFDEFFRDYGMLEDAHMALRAGRRWTLLQSGDARCEHLISPRGRQPRRKIGYKSVVNYYYVFQDMVGPLTWRHQLRFWRFQLFELFRTLSSAVRRRRWSDVEEFYGRLEGWAAAWSGKIKPNS
jgi:glycosyltransferase involved in cell wall biosynthesis